MNAFSKCSLILGAAAVIAVPSLFAGKPAPPPPATLNVTTIVHDEDAGLNQLLLRSDDYNGVFQASYNDPSNYSSTTSLTNSGWGLALFTQSLRTIWLTLSKPVGNSPPSPAPDGHYAANVEMYSRCYNSSNQQLATSNLAMTPGTAYTRCDLGVDFSSGSTKYKFVMSPAISGTGWAMVACNTADSTGKCNSWTISPNTLAGNGNVPTVANLYRFDQHGKINLGGSANFDFIGSYYNTFLIDVTNP